MASAAESDELPEPLEPPLELPPELEELEEPEELLLPLLFPPWLAKTVPFAWTPEPEPVEPCTQHAFQFLQERSAHACQQGTVGRYQLWLDPLDNRRSAALHQEERQHRDKSGKTHLYRVRLKERLHEM